MSEGDKAIIGGTDAQEDIQMSQNFIKRIVKYRTNWNKPYHDEDGRFFARRSIKQTDLQNRTKYES